MIYVSHNMTETFSTFFLSESSPESSLASTFLEIVSLRQSVFFLSCTLKLFQLLICHFAYDLWATDVGFLPLKLLSWHPPPSPTLAPIPCPWPMAAQRTLLLKHLTEQVQSRESWEWCHIETWGSRSYFMWQEPPWGTMAFRVARELSRLI